MTKHRCAWATDDLLAEYHDREWGVPTRDDRYLFEMITLEGAQAGLSWRTVLAKRDNYRRAFADFDARRLLKFTAARRRALRDDAGLIRHAGKIDSVFGNARAFLEVQADCGSFVNFIDEFEDAAALSRGLKKRGFKFVGPTICHAFRQAVGLINDHERGCFRRAQLTPKSRAKRPR